MKKERALWNAKHFCMKGHSMKRTRFIMEGMEVRGWVCRQCHETVLHPEDAQRMFLFNKLKRGISIKVGSLGNALIVRFPKAVAKFYGIEKGIKIILRSKDTEKLELIPI